MSRLIAERLAQLAHARAQFLLGCVTATACGNVEWLDDKRTELDSYDREINSLKQRATHRQLAEAREITNAPI